MKINEKTICSYMKNMKDQETNILFLNKKNISKFCIKTKTFHNIQFLSLESNNLTDIEFIVSFPNLFYLNIKKNHIANYNPLKNINLLGYLAVTLDNYSYNSFSSVRKINIGILEVNKEYTYENLYLTQKEAHLQNELFLQNSSNIKQNEAINNKNQVITLPNILSVNNKIVFADKIYEYANIEGLSIKFSNNINSNSIICHEIKEKFYSFLDEWHKEFKTLQSISSDDKMKMFNEIPYKRIESLKAMIIFKIKESLTLNFGKLDNIKYIDRDNDFSFKFFSKKALITDDRFYQKFILIILLLFILKIISFKLAINLTKFVLESDLNFDIKLIDISDIYNLDTIFLAGLYLELLDHYKNYSKIKTFNSDNHIVFDNYDNHLKILDLLDFSFILHLNRVIENEKKITSIYKEGIDYKSRKKLIDNTIEFLDKELNFLNESLLLIQHMFDFIVYTKNECKLLEKAHSDYRVFLEVRGCFFQYMDKKGESISLFDNLTDRKFFYFKNSNRANSMPLNRLANYLTKEEKKRSKLSPLTKKEENNNNPSTYKKNSFIKVNSDSLFVTGCKSRNDSINSNNLLENTLNIFSVKKQMKNNEENHINKYHSERKEKTLLDTQKLHSSTLYNTKFNKFVYDDNYLKNFCKEILKNKNTNKTIDKLRSTSKSNMTNDWKSTSLKKKGKIHSLTSINFNRKSMRFNSDDMKEKNNTSKEINNLNTISNIKLSQESKRKNYNQGSLLSKFQLEKIDKFKQEFINQRGKVQDQKNTIREKNTLIIESNNHNNTFNKHSFSNINKKIPLFIKSLSNNNESKKKKLFEPMSIDDVIKLIHINNQN